MIDAQFIWYVMSHIKLLLWNSYRVSYEYRRLRITGFIFRLSTQDKVEERLKKFAISETGSFSRFNDNTTNTILKSVD
jgi:hypothetical protein